MRKPEEDSHKNMRPAEIAKTEKNVHALLTAFDNFSNAFDVDDPDALYCIFRIYIYRSSGRQASVEIAKDLTNLLESGQKLVNKFVQERFVDKTVKFHATLPRSSIKTFASPNKSVAMTTSQKQTFQLKILRNLLGQLLVLSETHELDFRKVLGYSLSPVPWSLDISDGLTTKPCKAKLMHLLEHESAQVG